MDYIIVLFKNREKRKIINKFKTYERAYKFFNKLVEDSNNVVFDKKTENGSKCSYEICLMTKNKSGVGKLYIKDELGRTIKVDTDSDDYDILKVVNFKKEEEFLDYQTKKRIDYNNFEKNYLSKSGVKMISKLNNKIILQNGETIKLFTFKNIDDAERFILSIEQEMIKKKRIDCIIVNDFSFPQRKYLYDLLVERGFPKSYLQRYSTTHHSKK